MILFALFLLGLIIASPGWAQESPPPVPEGRVELELEAPTPAWRRLWDEARDFVRRGDLLAAAETYRKLLSQRQGLDQARWEYAQVLERLEKTDEAIKELELYLEKSPDNREARSLLATLLLKKGFFSQAEEQFRRLLAEDPEDSTARRGLALALYGQGRFAEALPFLRESLSLFSKDLELKRALAFTLVSLKKTSQATVYLRDLYLAGERDRMILKDYAQSLLIMGKTSEALPVLRQLAASFPEESWAHLELAKVLLNRGEIQTAEKELKVYLRRHPRDTEALKTLGKIYLDQGNLSLALRLFSRAASLNPQDTEALDLLAMISEARQLYRSAIRYLKRGLSLEDTPDRRLRLARDLLRTRRYNEALKLLAPLENPEALRLKAQIYRRKGAYEQFLKSSSPISETFEVLIFLAPFRPELRDRLWASLPELIEKLGKDKIKTKIKALARLGLGSQLLSLDLPSIERARILLQEGRSKEAIEALSGENSDEALLLRARIFSRKGHLREALKNIYALPQTYFFREERPRLELLARLYSGHLHEVLYLAPQRLSLTPNDGYYYGLLKEAFHRFGLLFEEKAFSPLAGPLIPPLKGDVSSALLSKDKKALQRLLKKDSRNSQALWILANIYRSTQPELAIRHLNKLLNLYPRHYAARLLLYELYQENNQKAAALLVFRETHFAPLCSFEPCRGKALRALSRWEEQFDRLSGMK